MNKGAAQRPDLYYRLIALWILCEAMVGGIIHGLKIPVSGLVVGSAAVTCICLIAWYVPQKGAIIKATIIVAVFKMILSPQASLPAYIAVFFQGSLGEILFWNRKYYRASCLVLAVLSLVESGLQRILVLTIVYGNDIWVVVNDFINGITGPGRRKNYSLLIGSFYIIVHLLTGIVVGLFCGTLPQKIENFRLPDDRAHQGPLPLRTRSSGSARKRKLLIFIWIALLLIFIQSELSIGNPLLPTSTALKILVRSLIVVGAWIMVVSPALNVLLRNWLTRKQSRLKNEINTVREILPGIESIIQRSWLYSDGKKGLHRIRKFSEMLLALVVKSGPRVHIFTGPIHSGKTSLLEAWAARQHDAGGILTPLRNGKRVFFDIRTGEEFPMESLDPGGKEILVGRYRFDAENFARAIKILEGEIKKGGWIVVDEIGPLELRNEGFAKPLKEILQNPHKNILLVVREGIVDEVINKFHISDYVVSTELPVG